MNESENKPGPFELWRQDDHGNRFMMKSFDNPSEAETERKMFEDRGHHQMYEVLDKSPQTTEESENPSIE